MTPVFWSSLSPNKLPSQTPAKYAGMANRTPVMGLFGTESLRSVITSTVATSATPRQRLWEVIGCVTWHRLLDGGVVLLLLLDPGVEFALPHDLARRVSHLAMPEDRKST